MTPGYVTVFQVSRFSDWPFAFVGLAPLTVGAIMIAGKRRFHWERPHWILPAFFMVFGLFLLAIVSTTLYSTDTEAFNALQTGSYSLVTGAVTNFDPMPYEGHRDECFSVESQRFCYSDYGGGPGFHNSTSHGGPIREGLPVRIAYINSTILHLEVAQNQAMTPAESAAIAKASEQEMMQRTENDPVQQQMMMAFLLVATAWTLWWNLQWKRVMRFWLRPPYRPATQYGFRIFFAANFIGIIAQTVQQLRHHPLTRSNIGPTLEIAALMGVIVGGMSNLSLRLAERRDRKATEKAASVQ